VTGRLSAGVGVRTGEDRIGDRLRRCGLTWPCSSTSGGLKMCALPTKGCGDLGAVQAWRIKGRAVTGRLSSGVDGQTGEDRIGDRLRRCGLTWPCSLTSGGLRICLLLTRYLLILLLSLQGSNSPKGAPALSLLRTDPGPDL
jgi:hypothetical protein